MWKDYSISFLRKNRASSISIMSAALIASMLLSALCIFFYNLWVYDVESVILEEGDWQGRITGVFSEEDIGLIRSFANVERVVAREETAAGEGVLPETNQTAADSFPDAGLAGETVWNGGKMMVLDLYFHKPGRIYQDMTLLSERFGLAKEQVEYHYQLLSMYFIRIPGDDKPRMGLPFYAAVLLTACFSLVLVIHNSFAVSMNARIHQLGILSGIGATPRQIRTCLIQEAAALCVFPVIGGSLAGTGIGYGLLEMMDAMAAQMTGRHDLVFRCHPLIMVLTVSCSMLTVLVSAWIPAGRLAKMTPLEAIRGTEEMQLTRKKHSPVLSLLFGIEGELAGNALKAQKKALRTSTISLTLAFFGFTIMMCFFKLSAISTDYTYFARYQDAWDVMATVRHAGIEDLEPVADLQEKMTQQGASSCVVYQKAFAVAEIPAAAVSDEVDALGGLEALGQMEAAADESRESKMFGQQEEKSYAVQAAVILLDDAGFKEYCGQIGVDPRLDGAVVLNRIWDSVNSNFRYREYLPYIKENYASTVLQCAGQGNGTLEIPVIGYTDQPPVLREECDDYALVHILPLSLWRELSEKTGQGIDVEENVYVRILMNREDALASLDENGLHAVEETLGHMAGRKYEIQTENRIQEKVSNDRLIWGYQVVIGIFCALLAVIGLANVFSYTLGFLRQRRRECARYLSVGMTPDSLKKMFCIEMLVIAGRPVLITLPITVLAVSLMIKASYLNPAEFWLQAPYVPVAVFIAAIFGFVAIAYWIGGRRILRGNLAEALRNEAVM